MNRAPSKLDVLELDLDIGSKEGVSRDHAARIRMQYLLDQTALFTQQTQFADTKATAVLALAGVVGARVAVSFDLARLGPIEYALLALTALALTLCLFVLIPRYPPEAERRALLQVERYSWVSLSAPGYTVEEYVRFVRSAEIAQLISSAATVNIAMARILAMKFRYLRMAFIFAIAVVAGGSLYLLGAFDLMTPR
jgi:hypothetical protein